MMIDKYIAQDSFESCSALLARVAKTLHSSYEPNPEISKASYF